MAFFTFIGEFILLIALGDLVRAAIQGDWK